MGRKLVTATYLIFLAQSAGQQVLAFSAATDALNLPRRQQQIILFGVFALLGVVLLLVCSMGYNYYKARKYALELREKNKLIEDHSRSLAILNEKILGQNAALEEDNDLKNKLLSVISHDLRHPLTNTKSILDLVNMKLVSNEEAQPLFAQLEAQYGRSINLLDNLLYWIKNQIHGSYMQREDVKLHRLVVHIIDEQKMPLQRKRLEVFNNIDEQLEWHCEREILRIILRNLFTNAIKFTEPGGWIKFGAELSGDKLQISVEDNGVGMDAQTLQKVSAENHYTSRGTNDEEGSGLGLMLIRDLIKSINGNLLVDSEPGKGSLFTLEINDVDDTCLGNSAHIAHQEPTISANL